MSAGGLKPLGPTVLWSGRGLRVREQEPKLLYLALFGLGEVFKEQGEAWQAWNWRTGGLKNPNECSHITVSDLKYFQLWVCLIPLSIPAPLGLLVVLEAVYGTCSNTRWAAVTISLCIVLQRNKPKLLSSTE
jgi:hypothetical protein